MFTLLDFQPKKRILVMTISTISMRQNRSISFRFQFQGAEGKGVIITHIFMYGANDPLPNVGEPIAQHPDLGPRLYHRS